VAANLPAMPRVALPPIALVVLGGIGDAAGLHAISFLLLVLAVPAAAVAALVSLDTSLGSRRGGSRPLLHAWLHALSLVFLLVATAARAPAHGQVPRVAASAYVACLLVLAVQGLVAAAPTLRGRTQRLPAPDTQLAEP
jgi:hypothetical protein